MDLLLSEAVMATYPASNMETFEIIFLLSNIQIYDQALYAEGVSH